jgi:ABC-type glycerol-3-phosphate transport system substrate-binding protein
MNGVEVMKLRMQAAGRGRRALVAAAAVSIAAIALSGCGAGGGGGAATDDAALTIVVEGGGKAELQPIADLYQEETGTEITLVELPYAGLYDRISSELQAGEPSFDIAALDAIWLPACAPGLARLDDVYTDVVQADLFGGLVSAAHGDETFVGLPVWTNCEILFNRTDLLEQTK